MRLRRYLDRIQRRPRHQLQVLRRQGHQAVRGDGFRATGHGLTTTSAAFLKSARRSSFVIVFACSVFIPDNTENITNPPFLRGTIKYWETRVPPLSSQVATPRKTT